MIQRTRSAQTHYPFSPPPRHWLVLTEILGTSDLASAKRAGRPFILVDVGAQVLPVCGFIPNFAPTAKILYLILLDV